MNKECSDSWGSEVRLILYREDLRRIHALLQKLTSSSLNYEGAVLSRVKPLAAYGCGAVLDSNLLSSADKKVFSREGQPKAIQRLGRNWYVSTVGAYRAYHTAVGGVVALTVLSTASEEEFPSSVQDLVTQLDAKVIEVRSRTSAEESIAMEFGSAADVPPPQNA